ncbi:hemicentin-1-like isoform X1 [Sycon ciliatum]|uniref:hemicentin-1-like isoform X1 n=1 Tax=Sycon ciliatum TaxID=27933 RepID=UPI0031F6DE96
MSWRRRMCANRAERQTSLACIIVLVGLVAVLVRTCAGDAAASVAPNITTHPGSYVEILDLVVQTASSALNGYSITCAASGSPQPTITFYRNNALLTSSGLIDNGVNYRVMSSKATILLSSISGVSADAVASAASGWYTCLAANEAGLAYFDFTIAALTTPVIVNGPTNLTVYYHLASNFAAWHCAVNGIPTPTVTWQKDGKELDTTEQRFKIDTYANHHYLTVRNLSASDAGAYECVATNKVGRVTSSTAYLTLQGGMSSATSLLSLPNTDVQKVSTRQSSSTQITITLLNVFTRSQVISWYALGVPVTQTMLKYSASSGKLSEKLKIEGLQEADSGVYSLKVDAQLFSNARRLQSASQTLLAIGEPTLLTAPLAGNIVKAAGRTITVACAGNQSPLSTITWRFRQATSTTWLVVPSSTAPHIIVRDLGSLSLLSVQLDGVSFPQNAESMVLIFECRLSNYLQSSVSQMSNITVSAACDSTENWILNAGPTDGSNFWTKNLASSHPSEGLSLLTDSITGEAVFANSRQVNSTKSYSWYQNVRVPAGATSFFLRAMVRSTSTTALEHYPVVRINTLTSSNSIVGRYNLESPNLVMWTTESGNYSLTSTEKTIRVFLGVFGSGKYTHANTALYKHVCLRFDAPEAKPTITSSLSTQYVLLSGSSITLPCEADGFPRPQIEWKSIAGAVVSLHEDGRISIANLTFTGTSIVVTCSATNRNGQDSQGTVFDQQQGQWGSWSTCSDALPSGLPSGTCGGTSVTVTRTRTCSPSGAACTGLPTSNLNCCVPATTQAPTSPASTTPALTTQAPTTGVPMTQAPTTGVPMTQTPTTGVPMTQAPTTLMPTTPPVASNLVPATSRDPPTQTTAGPSSAQGTPQTNSQDMQGTAQGMTSLPTGSRTSAPPNTVTAFRGTVAGSGSSNTIYIAIGAAVGGALLLIIIIILIVCTRRKSKSDVSLSSVAFNNATGEATLTPKHRREDSMSANPRYTTTTTTANNGRPASLTREDSMLPNPKYDSLTRLGGATDGDTYNEIPSVKVQYVARQGSSDSYIDMNHSAANYDRPSPVPEQRHSSSNLKTSAVPPSSNRGSAVNLLPKPDYEESSYVEANPGGPAIIQPVSLNPSTSTADYVVANPGGPAVIQPVSLNPSTITADKAMYEVAQTGQRGATTNFYEIN